MASAFDKGPLCAAGAVATPGAAATIATLTLPPGQHKINVVTFATTPDAAKTADMQLVVNGTTIGPLLSMVVGVPLEFEVNVRPSGVLSVGADSGIVLVRSITGSGTATYAAAIVATQRD